MNLLQRDLNDLPPNSILYYRQYQHNLIPSLIKLCFRYLRQLGFQFDSNDYKEQIIEDVSYHSIHHFSTKLYKIKVKPTKDYFLAVSIPELIHSQFFELGGAYYIPGFYISDLPVVAKKRSLLCYSLFNSLTFFNDDNRVTFLGNNIPISRFLRVYLSESEIELACSKDYLNCKYVKESENISFNSLSSLFGVNVPDKELIKQKIDLIFFDEWTKGLYQSIYNKQDINSSILIKDLLFNTIVNKDEVSYIDLNYKRLMFIEVLLAPLFRSVSTASKYILNGQQPFTLKIGMGDIISYFFTKMNKFSFYNVTNGFTGLLDLKATFKNPNSTNANLPKEVSSIHPSYKGKVDIVSISNTKPGETINLVPNQVLKDLKYGIFDF
jgi:hypothetical protein